MGMNNIIFALCLAFLSVGVIGAYTIKQISPYESNEFRLSSAGDLSSEKYYVIYQFKNTLPPPETHGDLVLQFKIGQGYSTKIALYGKQEHIKQNAKGEFIDSEVSFDSVEKEFILTKDTKGPIGPGDVFIVIYDLTYVYEDSFQIFNEMDSLPIKSNVCIKVPHFYSKEKLTFRLSKTTQPKFVSFSMTSSTTKIPTILIKENETQLKEYSEANKQEEIPINKTPGAGDIFIVVYKKDQQVYDVEFTLTFCVELLTDRIISLEKGSIQKNYAYSSSFYFKLDLSNYDANEENGVFLNIAYRVTDSFDGFYCKHVLPSEKEEELLPQYPKNEEENQCAFIKDDLMDTSYHLYFQKSKADLTTLLVLVRVKEKQIEGGSFFIAIPERIRSLTQNEKRIDWSATKPFYYKINPNTIQENAIISIKEEMSMSIIFGSLSIGKQATLPIYRSQLFAVNKKEGDALQPVVFIKLYQPGKINFEAYFVKSKVIFAGGNVRPRLAFNAAINNCKQSVYLIGSYSNQSDDFLSLEPLYGKGTVYHKASYAPSKTIAENLPDETSKPLTGTIKVWNNVDLMKITCTIPISLLINFSSQEKPPQIVKAGDTYKTIIDKDQTLSYEIIPSTKTGLEARIETESAVVELIIDGDKKTVLNKDKRSYKANWLIQSNANYAVAFKAISAGTVSFKIGSDSLYTVIKKDKAKTKAQNILIEINERTIQNEDYYSVLLKLSTEEKGLSLCYSQSMSELLFVPLPKNNCKEFKTPSFELDITNPFDKYITSKEKYYIAIAFNKAPTSDVDIALTYSTKDQSEPYVENQVGYFNKEKKRISTYKSKSDLQKELIAFTFMPCSKERMDYTVSFNRETILTVKDIKERKTDVINNNYASNDLELSVGTRLFSYSYVTQAEYEDSKQATQLYQITIDATNEKKLMVKFLPFVRRKKVQYDVYVVKSDSQEVLNDLCILFESKLEPYKTELITMDVGPIVSQIPVPEYGKYKVNIIAETKEGVIMTALYQQAEITVEEDKEEEKSKSWIWILIGCIGGVALIGGIAYAVYIYKRKQRREISAINEPFDTLV